MWALKGKAIGVDPTKRQNQMSITAWVRFLQHMVLVVVENSQYRTDAADETNQDLFSAHAEVPTNKEGAPTPSHSWGISRKNVSLQV